MKVPTTPSKGLFLKYFVLKLDGSDEAALFALRAYGEACGSPELKADIERHIASLKKEKK